MCSLTFFPRILQNEAFRAPSKLRRFQMLDLRKAKTITKGHPKSIYDGYSKLGTGLKKFYHQVACLPQLDNDGYSKISLLEKCKIYLASIYEHIISRIVKKDHQESPSDVGFAATAARADHIVRQNAQQRDPGTPLKYNFSDSRLSARDKTVFKDVLSRFPLQPPPKSPRRHYRDRKVDNTCSTKKKDCVETGAVVSVEDDIKPKSRRHTRKQVMHEVVRAGPIGGLNLSSWVTMDQTTEAMLNFLKKTERRQDVRCVREIQMNIPGRGFREEMKKKSPPPCSPPLGPPPILKPPPGNRPPLPACPKPRSGKQ